MFRQSHGPGRPRRTLVSPRRRRGDGGTIDHSTELLTTGNTSRESHGSYETLRRRVGLQIVP